MSPDFVHYFLFRRRRRRNPKLLRPFSMLGDGGRAAGFRVLEEKGSIPPPSFRCSMSVIQRHRKISKRLEKSSPSGTVN
jgi:hypothetical protein